MNDNNAKKARHGLGGWLALTRIGVMVLVGIRRRAVTWAQRAWRGVLCAAAGSLMACGADEGLNRPVDDPAETTSVAPDIAADTIAERDTGEPDSAAEPDTTPEADSVASDDTNGDTAAPAEPQVGDLVTLTQIDGGVVRGELVARYDHRNYWLEPEDTETWAIFDPAALAVSTTDDKSLSFVDQRDVQSVTHTTLPVGAVRYREALRAAGITIEAVPLDGTAYIITAGTDYHLQEWGYGHFAWDFGLTDTQERTWSPPGTANADYYVWDAPLRSPVGGEIVEVVRDAPDNSVDLSTIPFEARNNLVGVRVFGNYYVYLLHQRQDTISATLTVGDTVAVGDPMGRVGNSGVSQVPHLHLVLLWYDATAGRSWSVPAEFEDVHLSTSPNASSFSAYAVPTTGVWVSNAAF